MRIGNSEITSLTECFIKRISEQMKILTRTHPSHCLSNIVNSTFRSNKHTIYRKRKYTTINTNPTMKASGAYFRSIVYALIRPFLPYHVIQLLRSPLVFLRIIHQLLARRRHIFVSLHFRSVTIKLFHAMHHFIDVLSHNVLDVD